MRTPIENRRLTHLVCAAALFLVLGPAERQAASQTRGESNAAEASSKKICIAHRGASAYAPEHTLTSYRLAVEMGADYIEPDLVMSRDGVLICLHDVSLERTTNVALLHPQRHSNTDPSGRNRKTWLAADFNLEEIKQLDAGSWFGPEFAGERIPTFQEVIDLAKTSPGTGIYPEIKDPGFHHQKGFKIEDAVLKILEENGLNAEPGRSQTPVILQCFNPESLQYVDRKAKDAYPLIQLISPRQTRTLTTETGLAQVALYADGIGPALPIIMASPEIVRAAHELGLLVHPYTITEKALPELFPDCLTFTHHVLYELGADGVFTDHPDDFPRPKDP